MPQARWICPNENCKEKGVLAPTRPRKDDVRRFCLSCSASTGRLVERIAPALIKEREKKAEASKARRQAKLQKEKNQETAYYTVAGLDLQVELKRMLKAPTLKKLKRRNVSLKVRRASRCPSSRLGWAKYWKAEIQVTTYPGQDRYEAQEILLHELCHLAAGQDTFSGQCHHGPHFKKLFREAMYEVFGDAPGLGMSNVYVGNLSGYLREKEKVS